MKRSSVSFLPPAVERAPRGRGGARGRGAAPRGRRAHGARAAQPPGRRGAARAPRGRAGHREGREPGRSARAGTGARRSSFLKTPSYKPGFNRHYLGRAYIRKLKKLIHVIL